MSRPTSPLPAERSSPPSACSLELYTQQTTTSKTILVVTNAFVVLALEYCSQHFMFSENELIEEIKLLKEQRKKLEHSRQELLKKGRELLALNRHRRNQGIITHVICKFAMQVCAF